MSIWDNYECDGQISMFENKKPKKNKAERSEGLNVGKYEKYKEQILTIGLSLNSIAMLCDEETNIRIKPLLDAVENEVLKIIED